MAEVKRQKVATETRAEQQQIENAKIELASITKSKFIENAKTVFDACGVIDPTPTCDAVSSVLSLATGDYPGALSSAISLVPYVGDAIGKSAKLAKAARKAEELAERLAKATKLIDKAKKAIAQRKVDISKDVATKIREGRITKGADGNICYGTQLPRTGKWETSTKRGDCNWISEDGKHVVPYEKGYPKLSIANTVDRFM
jgi:hypothetical protein